MRIKTCLIALTTVLLCLLATQPAVHAQEDRTVSDLKDRVAGFFSDLENNQQTTKRVFQRMLEGGPLADRNEALDRLLARFEDLKKDSGKFLMAEALSDKQVGADLVLLKYLYKAEKYPIVWRFTFYRPPKGMDSTWILISLRFDTRLEQLER